MFSEDVVGLVEEMGFQPSSELSSTDRCWAEVDRDVLIFTEYEDFRRRYVSALVVIWLLQLLQFFV